MSNIFDLNEEWQKIVTGAGTIDGQTIADIVEANGENTPDKIADMVAVVEKINNEIDNTKNYRTRINEQIDQMERNAGQMRGYILEAVEEIGEKKPDAPEFKIVQIDGRPWLKSVYTEFAAPRIEIVDERIIDEIYKKPQPAQIDIPMIAKEYTVKADAYRVERRELILKLKDDVEAKTITEAEARQALHEFSRSQQPQISGINVEQQKTIGFL